jgi:hypothetical protein
MSAVIHLESDTHAPGATLRGTVQLSPSRGNEGQRVELTVLWEARGSGGSDVGVIYYAVLCNGDREAASATHAFEVTLPALPLSYDGKVVTIGWHVRVRRLALLGDDAVFDEPFSVAWSGT